MDVILDGFVKAFELILSFDQEILHIVILSLFVSLIALLFAILISLPLGIYLGSHDYRFKALIEKIIRTLMGMPPVLCGLFVYLILMRRGPLGFLRLNYTIIAMIIAQTLLITPIILGLVLNMTKSNYPKIAKLAKTLGADKKSTYKLVIFELRYHFQMAIVSGFSRAISEVGAVMIVGGNIKGKTQVMTTYISELKGMGQFEKAVAVGIILLIISFVINSLFLKFERKVKKR